MTFSSISFRVADAVENVSQILIAFSQLFDGGKSSRLLVRRNCTSRNGSTAFRVDAFRFREDC
jgi:hypothetical protein